jgi:1,4-dihydroxy-6-naphthoate synthase
VKLRIGLSPCPNDTFIFHALLHGLIDTGGVEFEPVMDDVEGLNERLEAGSIEVTKASFAAFARVTDRYAALRTGGALGRGNGPLLVSREPFDGTLADKRVWIPGERTTAALLLRIFHPEVHAPVAARYDGLLRALQQGDADVALIIHELRFTYEQHGLHRIEDLGARFEATTGLPVPLGGIFVRRDVDAELALNLERWIAESLDHARQHPEACRDYVRAHAQEIAQDVTAAHIDLYVNEFSSGYGEEGERAIEELIRRAAAVGVGAEPTKPLFVEV